MLFRSSRLLEHWGYDVLAATSARQFLRSLAVESSHPDLIIVDYRLSEGENGIQSIRTIRNQLGRSIPAILMTGDIPPEPEESDSGEGGHALLHKPVESAKLRAMIQTLLSGTGQS